MKSKLDMLDGLESDSFGEGLVQKIVVHLNQYIINIDEEITSSKDYREVFYILSTATENDTIFFNINTPGGNVDTALQFVDGIKNSRACTIAKVYDASSAGGMIMLACDEIALTEYASMLIHSVSGGYYGKQQEIKSYHNFSELFNENLIRDTYSGFLSEKEIEEVGSNKDIWLNRSQIEKRLDNLKKYNESLLKDNEKSSKKKKN